MYRAPVSEKGIVVDGVNLLEEYRHFDALLVVGLGVVVELCGVEVVIDLLPSHVESIDGVWILSIKFARLKTEIVL